MTIIQKYLSRQTFTDSLFKQDKLKNLGLVVTIPAYAEVNLVTSLESLLQSDLPDCGVEVIVVINHPENADIDQKNLNQEVFDQASKWAKEKNNGHIQFLISEPVSFPKKHAGAGLARKVAMDEAVRRLEGTEIENPIIAAFDADATCDRSYLMSLRNHFIKHPKSLGCSINFEHPLAVNDQTDFERESIIQYELHLRYYQAGLAFAEHPHAKFTVGSSMAVTRDAYVLQGGMNRRKAGEDFWFMLKLMMAGEVSALTTCNVYPSSRQSFRVPFGTGRAMMEMYEAQTPIYKTAQFESFKRLKSFLKLVDTLYISEPEIHDELTLKFLETVDWKEIIAEIRLYTTDLESFRKRFFRWFNVFMVMKFFHFLRDEGEQDVPVSKACILLFNELGLNSNVEVIEMLQTLRHKKMVKPEDFTISIN
ncbi:hypothetical protein KFE94_00480 [bacterium SCSIO 12643]|nr:hypothetical protein KFE94_00480 [bacterium SCSIO 12643]